VVHCWTAPCKELNSRSALLDCVTTRGDVSLSTAGLRQGKRRFGLVHCWTAPRYEAKRGGLRAVRDRFPGELEVFDG
jgi:hypothetical protein